MKAKFIFTIAILSSLTGVSCGQFGAAKPDGAALGAEGPGGGGRVVNPFATCDRKSAPAFNICIEAVGSEYNDQDYINIMQTSCESTNGIFSTSNCDRSGSLGTCIVELFQANETHVTYYPGIYDGATAAVACAEAGGLFFPKN